MTNKLHIAVDIGASGGIHLVGPFKNETAQYREVFRFKNSMKITEDGLVWDTEYLFNKILEGIKLACKTYNNIVSVGIDTWGVDYVLMNDNHLISPVFAYRNDRTQSVIIDVETQIPALKLYALTGTQFQPFNTVYQLYWDKLNGRLDKATDFLMLPEYFFYLLTGEKVHEYTNATTSGMYNTSLHRYDPNIIKQLEFPPHLFREPIMPGHTASIKDEFKSFLRRDLQVVLVATHDTASAVESIDIPDDAVFLSSGTWSLIGVKVDTPILSDDAKRKNFTNEGGVGYIRLQKNIMGLWIIQELKKEFNIDTYEEMVELAKTSNVTSTFDVNDERFLSPSSMTMEVQSILLQHGNNLPITREDIVNAVFYSLAESYRDAIKEIENITGRSYKKLVIFGGGAKNKYLNEIIRQTVCQEIITHPIEASAIGNIKIQQEVIE
ncbi:MAG: rhamnulokinase [Candidatus Izemoplasmataceae bacterium]